MNRKKWWLIVRASLIVLFVFSIIVTPSKDAGHLFGRTVMITVLAITFLMDMYEYRKKK